MIPNLFTVKHWFLRCSLAISSLVSLVALLQAGRIATTEFDATAEFDAMA